MDSLLDLLVVLWVLVLFFMSKMSISISSRFRSSSEPLIVSLVSDIARPLPFLELGVVVVGVAFVTVVGISVVDSFIVVVSKGAIVGRKVVSGLEVVEVVVVLLASETI